MPSAPPTRRTSQNQSRRTSKSSIKSEQRPSTSKSKSPSRKSAESTKEIYKKPATAAASKTVEVVPCGQQVTVPPQLADILKMYVKAAMKTQPPELLHWSGAYFRAMANGEILPVKPKHEYPLRESPDGLSPGLLRVIDAQLGGKSGQKIGGMEVVKRWRGFGLSAEALAIILDKAGMSAASTVNWDKLMALMCSTIGQGLVDTMDILCTVVTDHPDGDAVINYTVWWNAYVFLAKLNGISNEKIQAVNVYLHDVTKQNSGLISPNDFKSDQCPPLE